MYINSRPTNTVARTHASCLSVSQSGNTVKLYVISLDRLSYFPVNCWIETHLVFFINASGKWKVVYTVKWHTDKDSEGIEGDSFPTSLFCCIKFVISTINIRFGHFGAISNTPNSCPIYPCVPRSLVTGVPSIYIYFFISFDQQSEYNVFHKLMSWQESSLWTNWRDDFPSSEEISYSRLQVSWPSSFPLPSTDIKPLAPEFPFKF